MQTAKRIKQHRFNIWKCRQISNMFILVVGLVLDDINQKAIESITLEDVILTQQINTHTNWIMRFICDFQTLQIVFLLFLLSLFHSHSNKLNAILKSGCFISRQTEHFFFGDFVCDVWNQLKSNTNTNTSLVNEFALVYLQMEIR